MTDPVEPPEVAAWKQATLLKNQTDEFNVMRRGNALAAALVAAREEYEVAHRSRMHAIDALYRVEAERDRLREALQRNYRYWLEAAEKQADVGSAVAHEQEERAKAAEAELARLREALTEALSNYALTWERNENRRVKTLYTGPDVLIEDAPLATEEP